MATKSPVQGTAIGVGRLALTGAIAATVIFTVCWIGAFVPGGPAAHMYLQLFTDAELTTPSAIIEGVAWSAAFGLIAGGLIAAVYNWLGNITRR